MYTDDIPIPCLETAQKGPLEHMETYILKKVHAIETWFRQQWLKTPPPITSSVDLRHAGFKLAPVDTNLFPAGFNNLNPEFLPLCVQAMQVALSDYLPGCRRVLLLPENHTRNPHYIQSLWVLRDIVQKAGFEVRLGSLDIELKEALVFSEHIPSPLVIEPLERKGARVCLSDFDPCVILLNNDLSTGIPEILNGIEQKIRPTAKLGWTSRLKSQHFYFYDQVVDEFSKLIDLDPWLINPAFKAVSGIDFMTQEGLELAATAVDELILTIKERYQRLGISHQPFVVVKADNGTYGMSVMMVQTGDDLRHLNRKQRTKMAATKGSQKVARLILQEGVYSFETMQDGSVAEPVIYMLGQFVVGGFYRVHQGRGTNENLNAPGMHFEPLAFKTPCNLPDEAKCIDEAPNRFYVYSVIARLAALAAAREIAAIQEGVM